MYYFFKTVVIDGRPRLRALPDQWTDAWPILTDLNVQADSIMRGSYPIGTVFVSDSIELVENTSTSFYRAERIYPILNRADGHYIVPSHVPPADAVSAYLNYLNETNNNSHTPMAHIYRTVKVTRNLNGSFVQNGILLLSNTGKVYYFTKDNSLPFNGENISAAQTDGITVPHSKVASANVAAGTSLATIALRIKEYFPFFFGYSVSFIGDAVSVNPNTAIDLDVLFAANNTPSADNEIVIKSGYTQNELYSGFGSYHSNQHNHHFNVPIQQDKPWRIGIELELYARTREAYDTITRARSNWFQCEGDSSLSQASFPIEMKTIPLKACDATSVDFWDKPMERLKQLAKSKGYSSTGLHVHISKEIFGSSMNERRENVTKLEYFYYYLIESNPENHAKNVKICGREAGYGGYTLDGVKTTGMSLIHEIGIDSFSKLSRPTLNNLINEQYAKNNDSRWDINTRNMNGYGTCEFRKGKGAISKTRLAGLCTWWEQMCLYCVNTPWSELNFDVFFHNVTSQFPAVAYFFNEDEEA